MADLALVFDQGVDPIALKRIASKYYIVYCCWLPIELVVVWVSYIGTRHTALEGIVKHFDVADALVGGPPATQNG